jgi:hypothetical protein
MFHRGIVWLAELEIKGSATSTYKTTSHKMTKINALVTAAILLGIAGLCSAQTSSPASTTSTSGSMAPYTEGSVWEITMIKTKPGMSDDYLKNLASAWKSTNDEAKKQGLITDYKVLIGDAANRDDYDVVLIVQYKNMAALDGLRDKTDPIARKVIGTEDTMRQASVKRMEIREILGTKTMREVTLK